MKKNEVKKNEQVQVENQNTQNTEIKKEEKKMSKKVEKVQVDERMMAYRQNENGEFLMTQDMFDEFKANHSELVFGMRKNDKAVKLVKNQKTDKEPMAIIRIDESAKLKQVHVHTGATKKVVSGMNEKDGCRYKVIFRQKNEKYELWRADPRGKRKMIIRGTEKEVMAEYEKMIPQKAEKKEKKTA